MNRRKNLKRPRPKPICYKRRATGVTYLSSEDELEPELKSKEAKPSSSTPPANPIEPKIEPDSSASAIDLSKTADLSKPESQPKKCSHFCRSCCNRNIF